MLISFSSLLAFSLPFAYYFTIPLRAECGLKRPALETESVNINLPQWMVSALDRESVRLDIDRQSIIKFWLAERLEKSAVR